MSLKLLDAHDYELINQLSLVAKRRISGLVTGEQRSPAHGGGIEFADYRDYQPGDDVRLIDWAVFLRLRRLLVKLCAEEKELTLMLLLDISRSMRFSNPDKLWQVQRIAAILAGVCLRTGNRIGVLAMDTRLQELLAPERSRVTFPEVMDIINRIESVPKTHPINCIRQFASRYSKKCMVVYLSDLLFPEWNSVINALGTSGCEGYIIQMLAPEEFEPPYQGEITLVDSENGSEVPLHIGYETNKLYRKELASFLKEVRHSCHRQGLGYTILASNTPLAKMLHDDLRKGGLLC